MWLWITESQWIRHLWYPKLFLATILQCEAPTIPKYLNVFTCRMLFFQGGLVVVFNPKHNLPSALHLTHCTVIFQKKVQNEAWPGAHSSLTHRGIQKWAPGEAGPWADLYSVHLVVGKISPSM